MEQIQKLKEQIKILEQQELEKKITKEKNDIEYNLEIVNKKISNYSVVASRYNLNNKIYIDSMAEFYVIGTTIDYIKEDFNNNIFESKFLFTPDKSLATNCGCGISFSLN